VQRAAAAPVLQPSSVEAVAGVFAAALNDGELAAAAACFTRQACLLTGDATAIRGREEIRAILGQLIASGARAEVEHRSLVLAGDVALQSTNWRTQFRGRSDHVSTATSNSVLCRIEGVWKLQIVSPWRSG
jgi:ketosteroid isomerase-like protein